MDLLNRLKRYLSRPDPSADAVCRREDAWVEQYSTVALPVPGAVVLRHAEARWAESELAWKSLSEGADRLLRTAGLLATILVASVGGLDLPARWPIKLAFCCFLASILVVVWSRRPLDCPARARIRDVLEGIGEVESPEAWLSASLHSTVEGLRVVNDWRAAWLQLASALLALGVVCLLPIALGL